MKKKLVLITALALLVLVPTSVAAVKKVGPVEAKVKATSALLNFYSDTYRYSSSKYLYVSERLSRTRLKLSYSFEYAPNQPVCIGDVTVFRGRNGGLLGNVEPEPGQDPPCN